MLHAYTTLVVGPPVPAPTKESFMAKVFGSAYTGNPTLFWILFGVCILLIVLLVLVIIFVICCCVRRRRKNKKKQQDKKNSSKKGRQPSKKESKANDDIVVVVANRNPEPEVHTAKGASEKSSKKGVDSKYAYNTPVPPQPVVHKSEKETSKKKELVTDEKKPVDTNDVQQKQPSERNEKVPQESEKVEANKTAIPIVPSGLATPRTSRGLIDEDIKSAPRNVPTEALPVEKTQENTAKSKNSTSKRSSKKHSHGSDSDCSCSESERSEKPTHKKNPADADKKDVQSAYYVQ